MTDRPDQQGPDEPQPAQPQPAEPDLPNDYQPPWQPSPEGNRWRILAIVGGFALLGIVGALVLSRCMG